MVVEPCVSGPLPLVPEAIRIVPANTAAASNQQLVGASLPAVDPGRECVEHDLLQHEAAIAPLAVDVVRIPLAEMIVRPLVDRVIEIVLPRIDGQLVEQVRVEPGFAT